MKRPPYKALCKRCYYRNSFIMFTHNFGKIKFSFQCSHCWVSTLEGTEVLIRDGNRFTHLSQSQEDQLRKIFWKTGSCHTEVARCESGSQGETMGETESWTVFRTKGYPAGCSDPVREALRQITAQFFPSGYCVITYSIRHLHLFSLSRTWPLACWQRATEPEECDFILNSVSKLILKSILPGLQPFQMWWQIKRCIK